MISSTTGSGSGVSAGVATTRTASSPATCTVSAPETPGIVITTAGETPEAPEGADDSEEITEGAGAGGGISVTVVGEALPEEAVVALFPGGVIRFVPLVSVDLAGEQLAGNAWCKLCVVPYCCCAVRF